MGTAAELSRQPYPSPRIASSAAAGGDPILGGELVIRVIDAQVSVVRTSDSVDIH